MEKVLTSDFTPLAIDLNSNPTPNPTSHELREELDRAKSENKKLTERLIHVKRDYENLMQSRLSDQGSDDMPKAGGWKRKLALDDDTKIPEYYNGNITSSRCFSCSCNGFISTDGAPKLMKSNVSKVYVRIDPSDVSLVVKDGYQWRKYGQKVTRDNPSPRAYYKCCFSPTCPAKKKVQRSVDDPSLLVATYEGDHQHHAAAASPTAISKTKLDFSDGCPKNLNSKDSMTYDKVQKAIANNDNREVIDHKLLASLLTRNRAFTDALAAAITGKILDEVVSENNNDDVSNSMIMSD